MPRAVVFDLDYTLAVPDRDREAILTDAARVADAPPLSRAEYLEAHRRNLTTDSREPIFADLLAERDSDADPAAVAAAYRRRIADALRPIEDADSLLETLRSRYRVGLLTNGPARAQREKLAELGWEDAFDAVAITGELAAGKPDARAFEAILDDLGVDPEDAVYIGDDVEADIEGATTAGLDAIQVLQSDGPGPDPRAVAHVERSQLAAGLPGLLESLEDE